jgi:hypothetical protein
MVIENRGIRLLIRVGFQRPVKLTEITSGVQRKKDQQTDPPVFNYHPSLEKKCRHRPSSLERKMATTG